MLTNNHMTAFDSRGYDKTMWTHRNSVLLSKLIPLKDLNESGVNSKIRSLNEQIQDFAGASGPRNFRYTSGVYDY